MVVRNAQYGLNLMALKNVATRSCLDKLKPCHEEEQIGIAICIHGHIRGGFRGVQGVRTPPFLYEE